jgi:hypothetical protein
MLAYATHLLQTEPVREARIHPDGQRARQVDFRVWLEKRGFRRVATARTPFAGTFEDAEGRRIVVHPLWPPHRRQLPARERGASVRSIRRTNGRQG